MGSDRSPRMFPRGRKPCPMCGGPAKHVDYVGYVCSACGREWATEYVYGFWDGVRSKHLAEPGLLDLPPRERDEDDD